MPTFQQSLVSTKVINSYLKALKRAGFSGDLGDQYADRVTYSTDNSVYQVFPQCVLYPKRTNDLNLILKVANGNAAFKEIVFSPRGGGNPPEK
ncbi:hypothetical protein Q4508_10520 [Amphritea sp. 2_MG-2023]|uniref:hypothetical protein n=1 Tax=Amphritea TaxID=515417 RepID=UPI001C07B251|nr:MULTISPECIES: hypothetical protein [Amphritea]MBU2966743.1 hypothetical protein [Amphritea atlantica]MDO6418992.1 hypothetical protein [Amphritea sp. 2_MG-2023]